MNPVIILADVRICLNYGAGFFYTLEYTTPDQLVARSRFQYRVLCNTTVKSFFNYYIALQ